MSDGIGSNIDGLRIAAIGAWEVFKSKYFLPLLIFVFVLVSLCVAGFFIGLKYHNEQMNKWRKIADEAQEVISSLNMDIASLKREGEKLSLDLKKSKDEIRINDEKYASIVSSYTNLPISVMVEEFRKRTGIGAKLY